MVFLCKFGQNPPIGLGDRVQTMLICTTFIVWWPWKFGQGHQNLINSFNYPNDTIHKVWPESMIWFKRQGADKLFWSKFDIQSAGVTLKMRQGHQNLIISSPYPTGVSMQVWSKSTIASGDRVQTRLIFTVFIVWVPWKLGQDHQNLTKSLNYPNVTIYEV